MPTHDLDPHHRCQWRPLVIVPSARIKAVLAALSPAKLRLCPEQLELVAELEHRRWLTEERLAGWRHTSSPKNAAQLRFRSGTTWLGEPDPNRRCKTRATCDDKRVEDFVEAECVGPRIGFLGCVDDRAYRVEYAAAEHEGDGA